MKSSYSKVICFLIMVVMCMSSLVGCSKGQKVANAEQSVPQTNLSVPAFDEDQNLAIGADRPVAPTEANLKDYKAAGFTHYHMTEDFVPFTNADKKIGTKDDGVINPEYIAALELCERLGLEVTIRNYYNDPNYFVNTDGGLRYLEPPNQHVSYTVPVRNITTELTEYPAVSRYFFTDEPSWGKVETLAPLVDWHNRYGGDTEFWINLLPSYGSFLFEDHSMEEYVDYYCDKILKNVTGKKVLSTDFYPLEAEAGTNKNYIKDTYLRDYMIFAKKVKEMNVNLSGEDKVRLNLCIEANSGSNMRPLTSVADVRFQVNVALAFGAKSLSYYGYTERNSGEGFVTAGGDKHLMYEWGKQANEEAQKLADAIMDFEWVGTKVYAGQQMQDETNASAFEKIAQETADSFDFISDITCRLDTLVSEMEDENGNKGYMVVNYSEPAAGLTDAINIYFGKKVNKAVVYINGERTVLDVQENAMKLKLKAGEGAFVYPVYDAEGR